LRPKKVVKKVLKKIKEEKKKGKIFKKTSNPGALKLR
jgi:hypothetical protein